MDVNISEVFKTRRGKKCVIINSFKFSKFRLNIFLNWLQSFFDLSYSLPNEVSDGFVALMPNASHETEKFID